MSPVKRVRLGAGIVIPCLGLVGCVRSAGKSRNESIMSALTSSKLRGVYDPFTDFDDKDRKWMEQAECLDAPAHIFFFEDEPAFSRVQVRRARALCDVCPVKVRCLEMALANREMFGVWGGTTPLERRQILRQRRKDGL